MVLNNQLRDWPNIKAAVPHESVLGPLHFLVYINDLPEGRTASAKLFVDDTSFFSIANDSTVSSASFNKRVYQYDAPLRILFWLNNLDQFRGVKKMR